MVGERTFCRSLMGVSALRSSSFMDCSTLSSMGRPWQSHPGTYFTLRPCSVW
jgi:hypothetical protein